MPSESSISTAEHDVTGSDQAGRLVTFSDDDDRAEFDLTEGARPISLRLSSCELLVETGDAWWGALIKTPWAGLQHPFVDLQWNVEQ